MFSLINVHESNLKWSRLAPAGSEEEPNADWLDVEGSSDRKDRQDEA